MTSFTKTFTKGKHYAYLIIETYANRHDIEMQEFGNETVGQSFIVLSNSNHTVSFVFTGYSDANGYIYECCYVY